MKEEVETEAEFAARLAVDIVKEIMATRDVRDAHVFELLIDYYVDAFKNELWEQGNPFADG